MKSYSGQWCYKKIISDVAMKAFTDNPPLYAELRFRFIQSHASRCLGGSFIPSTIRFHNETVPPTPLYSHKHTHLTAIPKILHMFINTSNGKKVYVVNMIKKKIIMYSLLKNIMFLNNS